MNFIGGVPDVTFGKVDTQKYIRNQNMNFIGGVPERSNGTDSRSVGIDLQGFESLPRHKYFFMKYVLKGILNFVE